MQIRQQMHQRMYEKDSQPLEVVVEHFIQTKFVRPKVRPYQTDKPDTINTMNEEETQNEI